MASEIGNTEVSSAQNSLVSQLVQQALREKSVLFPTVTNYGSFAGASEVKIPRVSDFSAANKSENTDLSNQELTFSSDTISLNIHKGVRATIEDQARLTAGVDVMAEVVKAQADEIAIAIDTSIAFYLKSASSSTPDHLLDYADSSGDTLAVADIANARALLRTQKVPMDDGSLYMAISPECEKELLNISNFIKADEYGDASVLRNGFIGRILGFNVVVTSLLSANESCFYHKSHVGFAWGMEPKFEMQRKPESLGDMAVTSALYGCNVLDGGKRGIHFNGSGS